MGYFSRNACNCWNFVKTKNILELRSKKRQTSPKLRTRKNQMPYFHKSETYGNNVVKNHAEGDGGADGFLELLEDPVEAEASFAPADVPLDYYPVDHVSVFDLFFFCVPQGVFGRSPQLRS